MRMYATRNSVLTGIATADKFEIGADVVPMSVPGNYLVGIGIGLRVSGASKTFTVNELSKITWKTPRYTFFERTILHDRQWKERFAASMIPEATSSGATSDGSSVVTLAGVGGYVCWFNDPRPISQAAQDAYGAPIGEEISGIIETTGSPSGGIVDLVYITVDQAPQYVSFHSQTTLSGFGASTDGLSKNLSFYGRLLAYGVPFVSLAAAASFEKFDLFLGGRKIANLNSIAGALMTETDQSIYAESGSITDPASGSVAWKSTRGAEFTSDGSRIDMKTGTTSLASTVFPMWSYLEQDQAAKIGR